MLNLYCCQKEIQLCFLDAGLVLTHLLLTGVCREWRFLYFSKSYVILWRAAKLSPEQKIQAAVIETQASCMSGVSSYSCTCFQSAVTCCKGLGFFGFFHTFCKVCVLHTGTSYVFQSFITSVPINAKPSTEALPLISDQLYQCLHLKSIPN